MAMELITNALVQLSLDNSDASSTHSDNSNATFQSESDAHENSSETTSLSTETISPNDRSLEIRNDRLANAIMCLDEDLPNEVDDTIKTLVKNHTNMSTGALGPMEFLVDEYYLEYKANMAAKRAMEKKLPRSKGRSARK